MYEHCRPTHRFVIEVALHRSVPSPTPVGSTALAKGSGEDCFKVCSAALVIVYVFTGLHRHTSSTNSVRWLTLKLVSDFVPPRLQHGLSAVLDCPPSMTGIFRWPLLEFGTVCLNTSPPHTLWDLKVCFVFLQQYLSVVNPSRLTKFYNRSG